MPLTLQTVYLQGPGGPELKNLLGKKVNQITAWGKMPYIYNVCLNSHESSFTEASETRWAKEVKNRCCASFYAAVSSRISDNIHPAKSRILLSLPPVTTANWGGGGITSLDTLMSLRLVIILITVLSSETLEIPWDEIKAALQAPDSEIYRYFLSTLWSIPTPICMPMVRML